MTDLHHRPADRYVIDEVLTRDVAGYRGLELGPGDVLLDLGAHIGTCVEYALWRGVDHVIAVEMLPETLQLLRRNFGQHPRVTIIPAAVVGDHAEPVAEVRRFRNPMGASISAFNQRAAHGKRIIVPTVPIRGLLEGFRPNKIKADIEGAEYDVITPFVDVINASEVTHVAAELHTKNDEMLAAARLTHKLFMSAGWSTTVPLERYPKKPNGWNVHPAFRKEQADA